MYKLSTDALRREGGIHTIESSCEDDILLIGASHEQRTLDNLQLLANDYKVGRSVIYYNREFIQTRLGNNTVSNLHVLDETLGRCSDGVKKAEGSWISAEEQLVSLRDALAPSGAGALEKNLNITVDITAFNREPLLTALGLLRRFYPHARIRILYTEPIVKYGEWLSRGFRMVRSVAGFPGVLRSNRSTVLVVLSGFEDERVLRTVEEYKPAKVLLGVGNRPDKRPYKRDMEERQRTLARYAVEEFPFPVDDVTGCKVVLEDIIAPYKSSYNLILAPMSTKLSTLSIFLVAEGHPECQIAYYVPAEYNLDHYSVGVESVIIEELPLASC
jgi:hypothetical protein